MDSGYRIYSAQRVDPADDCTFWFTGEINDGRTPWSWGTRIAAWCFPTCDTAGKLALRAVVRRQRLEKCLVLGYHRCHTQLTIVA